MRRKYRTRGLRYVHSEERKFKTEPPEDEQEVAYRIHGHKTYRRGVWNADVQEIWTSAGSKIGLRYLMG